MPDIHAIAIARLDSSSEAADGGAILLTMTTTDGTSLPLALPHDQVLRAIVLLSAAGTAAARVRGEDPDIKEVLPLEWWTIGEGEDGMVTLSFRLPGGAEMSFQVHRQQAAHMHETLGTLLGIAAPTPPADRPHH